MTWVSWVKVKGHLGQGQVRVRGKGRWAHGNVKLLHFYYFFLCSDTREPEVVNSMQATRPRTGVVHFKKFRIMYLTPVGTTRIRELSFLRGGRGPSIRDQRSPIFSGYEYALFSMPPTPYNPWGLHFVRRMTIFSRG